MSDYKERFRERFTYCLDNPQKTRRLFVDKTDDILAFIEEETEKARMRGFREGQKNGNKAGIHGERSRILAMVEGMRKETCDCEEDPGYHSKECDFFPFGYNAALDDLTQKVRECPNGDGCAENPRNLPPFEETEKEGASFSGRERFQLGVDYGYEQPPAVTVRRGEEIKVLRPDQYMMSGNSINLLVDVNTLFDPKENLTPQSREQGGQRCDVCGDPFNNPLASMCSKCFEEA